MEKSKEGEDKEDGPDRLKGIGVYSIIIQLIEQGNILKSNNF